MKKVAVLTSGGDAPGMNAAISAIVHSAQVHHIDVIGVKSGYTGLLSGDFIPLTIQDVENLTSTGGTFLKTSRCTRFVEEESRKQAAQHLKSQGIEHLIVIGGEGSLKGAEKLQQLGIQVIGIPGTIDNDIPYTDYSIGFDTTLNTVLDCISKLKDTDYSHDKTTIVEVMGRACGDLALHSAIAGEGEIISTPEKPLSFQQISTQLEQKIQSGKLNNIIIITEKMFKISDLQDHIKTQTGVEVRTAVLGFLQRGGRPSAFDRILARKMGVKAVELLVNGAGGKAIGIRENKIVDICFTDVMKKPSSNEESYDLLNLLL